MIETYRRILSAITTHPISKKALVVDATTAFDATDAECFYDEVHLLRDGEVALTRFIAGKLRESGLVGQLTAIQPQTKSDPNSTQPTRFTAVENRNLIFHQ